MRIKTNPQTSLDFSGSHLKVTQEYYAKYKKINKILLENPKILKAFHKDASKGCRNEERRRAATFTSDQFLRAILVMEIEQLSLRATVIRIDDSEFLHRFVGIPYGSVMDYTTLSKVYKAIRPGTWKRINAQLGEYAITQEKITGESLRVDTTVYETDVHYPTDSSLLWDGYRVVSRWIAKVREYDSEVVGDGRLQDKVVKRNVHQIARRASHKEKSRGKLKGLYEALLSHVEWVLEWSGEVAAGCEARLAEGVYDPEKARIIQGLLAMRAPFVERIETVLSQATRRVMYGELVPNNEKIFSLFESHTELLKRGKVHKPLEFGHMVLLGQVENKFISDYEVFEKRPNEAPLVDEILERHEEMFGYCPENFTADRGFYESTEQLSALEEVIANVSIAKKGSRSEDELEREHDPVFKTLQRFRAGIEGTISYLKRCFKMARCLYRSFKTYCASVGCHVFAHNLVVLSRL
jgi:IS5 family transposase